MAVTSATDTVRHMNTALAIGFASTSATLLVTIVLFGLDRILARRRDRHETRRLLVTRVLDVFDASTRTLIRPAFTQAWTNSEVEYALLTPRLLLDLHGRDTVIVEWLLRQVQRMQLAVIRRDRIAIRTAVTDRLLQWHSAAIGPQWFVDDLAADPLVANFLIPGRVRLKQFGRDSWGWAQVFAVLAGMAVLVRSAIKS